MGLYPKPRGIVVYGLALGAFSLLIVSSGCDSEAEIQQIKALEQKQNVLNDQIKLLDSQLETMQSEKKLDDLMHNAGGTAYLTPGDEGFSIIVTNLGPITVQLRNVQPFANGTRATLRFGNLTSATFTSSKYAIDWGTVDKSGLANNDQERTKNETVDSLKPGSWNDIQVVLDDTQPQQLGFVRVHDFSPGGMVLILPH